MTLYAPHTMSDAAVRAKGKVGKSTIGGKVGQCLAEQINPANSSPWAIPGPWGWGGNGKPWAINYWLNAVAKGKVVKTSNPADVPNGALAFGIQKTEVGKAKPAKAGHVWTSDGKSGAYTTDQPTNGKWGHVAAKTMLDKWGMVQLGYILVSGDGYTLTDPPTIVSTGKMDPKTYFLGAHSDAITWLGQRLVIHAAALGLQKPYKSGPGPDFTATDVAAVKAFQKAQDWTGSNADGYPGPDTLKRLAADPVKPGPMVETISANLAGYDAKKGMKNRVSRAKGIIPQYLAPKKPTWFHFQECAIDMFPELDKKLTGYVRVPEGGKGRESYYRKDAGITIVHAELHNVTHMLLKDTKEFLLTVWEIDGVRALEVNFHNENEGSTFQSLQLKDVLSVAREVAAKYDVKRANILVTGDSNMKGASALAKLLGWTESIYSAVKKIDLQYVSTNGWLLRLVAGRRIDVDITDPAAEVIEGEELFGEVIADHWPHRTLRRLTR